MKKKVIKAGDLEVFKRTCLYCGDELAHNCHKSRKFCPEKYGQNDHCKYHYKLLRQQNLIAGEELPTTIKASLQNLTLQMEDPPPMEVQSNVIENPVLVNESNNDRENNISFLSHRLGDQDEVIIDLKEMLQSKYNFKVFDNKEAFPDSNYFYNIVGEYAIWWHNSQTIVITKSILLTCLY